MKKIKNADPIAAAEAEVEVSAQLIGRRTKPGGEPADLTIRERVALIFAASALPHNNQSPATMCRYSFEWADVFLRECVRQEEL